MYHLVGTSDNGEGYACRWPRGKQEISAQVCCKLKLLFKKVKSNFKKSNVAFSSYNLYQGAYYLYMKLLDYFVLFGGLGKHRIVEGII